MGMFNNNVDIDENNPFKYDKLGREEEIKRLTRLFSIVENQMVLAIDSPWGTGKTTFLKMWESYLEIYDYTTIYYNSWKNDFVDDPFISFMGEFKNQLDSTLFNENLKSTISQLGSVVLKNGLAIGLTALKNKTGVDFDLLGEDDLKSLVDAKLENYCDAKKHVENFKSELKKTANENFHKTGKPLIIFVDELDRCRPDFAISLLERIKHLMNVENIIFVLGIDKDALSNSIKVIYGEGTDINGYLTRFIDLEYKLNKKYNEEFIIYLLDKYNFERFSANQPNKHSSHLNFVNLCKEIFDIFKFSLRDVEKIITRLNIIMGDKSFLFQYSNPLVFALSLRMLDKNVYNNFMMGEMTVDGLINELADKIDIKSWFENEESVGYVVDAYITIIVNDGEREKLRNKSSSNMDMAFIQSIRNIKYSMGHGNHKKYLKDRIDIYEFSL